MSPSRCTASFVVGQSSRLYPRRFVAWQQRGLSARAASAAALAGCDTIDDIAALGRARFERMPNIGAKSLAELAALAAWPAKPKGAVETIASTLEMALGPREAREVAIDVMSSLRRAGFLLTVRTRAQR
jgi:hypothetical protein